MSFNKAILTVGGLTLGSRILGFARDILTAAFLGAGPVADAFFVALKLPNFFRRITAEGAFSVSFVPLFAGELEKHGKEEAIKFAEEAQAMMLAVLIPFTVLAIVAMPWVLYVIAPGFGSTPERYDLALEMSRVTFPYILFMSLTALLGGVMNSFGKFGPFAAAPMLFNLTLMIALLFFTDMAGTAGHAMSWGVSAAGILQLLFLMYYCRKIGVSLKLYKPRVTPRLRKLFKNMVPGVFGAGIAQINLFVDMILASLLPVGSISFLYYADRLYQLPLSVIGTAIGTAMLPMLTRAIRGKDDKEAHRLFTQGIETSLVLAMPATAAYIAIAVTIMDVLFARGAFTAENSQASAYALMGYSIGLPAFILSKVMSAAFFAREDTKSPVVFAVICAVMNTLVALCLISPFQHVGIAIATGATAWINILLLGHRLWKRKIFHIDRSSVKRISIIIMSSLLMAGALVLLDHYVMPYFMRQGQVMRIIGLAGMMGLGGGVYGVCLYMMGVLRFDMLKRLFPKRQKKDTINQA